MARSWSDCVASSKSALSRIDEGWSQIGKDAAEAIPPGTQGVDAKITARIAAYADEVGVEASTIERWRSIALFFGRVMDFPPTGGFRNVGYSALRELQTLFPGDAAGAFAFLSDVVENDEPPGKGGRWTRQAILDRLEAEPTSTPDAGGSDDTEDGEEGGAPEGDSPAAAMTAAVTSVRKAQAKAKVKAKKGSAGDDQSLTPAERIHRHLQAVWSELPGLDREVWGDDGVDELRVCVEKALAMTTEVLIGRRGVAA
jgi:hypothetical protein